MADLVLRLVVIALGRVGEGMVAAVHRATVAVVCVILGSLALFAALVCIGVGVWLFTASQIGQVGASAVVAGTLLLVALALMVTARQMVRRKAPPPTEAATDSALLQEAARLLKTHKEAMLLAALVAGVVAETFQRRK
jgi:hypothetical protein